MASEGYDASTLNGLLATVVDSVDGFEQAIAAVETSRFKAIFQEVASDRQGLIGEIEAEIRAVGGTPEEKGTILGSAHRVLIRIRDAVSSGDVAVVDEAERGEDHIKHKFEKASQDDELSPTVRSFVTTASSRVTAGHNKIRDLKHALHGSN